MVRSTLALLALFIAAPLVVRGERCLGEPFSPRRKHFSLRDQIHKTQLIVLAEALEPREGDSETVHRFQILESLKSPLAPVRARTFSTRLHAYRPPPGSRWIVYCALSKQGEPCPFRAFDASPAHLDYLKGLIRFADDPEKALAHCVLYLEHPVEELAADANTELGRAGDKQLRVAARVVPAERVAGWLRDPKVHFHRHNAYGLLLGYCGDARHAELLYRMVTDRDRWPEREIDGLLAGYVLLRPEEGWPLVQRILLDRSAPTRARSSALEAVRFFWDQRTNVLPRVDMLRALMPLVADWDFAAVIILDLGRWQRWEMTDVVLARWQKLSQQASAARQAIVGFALRSPRPQAAAFVARVRREVPDAVALAEVILRAEKSLKSP